MKTFGGHVTAGRLRGVISRLLACALVLAACGGAAAPPTPRPPSLSPIARTTAPSPSIPFDEMMGAAPVTTVFVVSGGEALAITLLNHFVRYRIPVGEEPQLTASPDGARLYIADRLAGELRYRWFDVPSGELRSSRSQSGTLVTTGLARGALAADSLRLYALENVAGRTVLQAYDAIDLRPALEPVEVGSCAERVLASDLRVGVACLARGELKSWMPPFALAPRIVGLPGPLAGAAMRQDGAVGAVHSFGTIYRLGPGARTAEEIAPPEWVKTPVARDGVAWADRFTIVIAQDEPQPRVHVVDTVTDRVRSFDLPTRPGSGILASGRFAYWLDEEGGGVFHIDLQSGLVERMYGPLVRGATLGALALR